MPQAFSILVLEMFFFFCIKRENLIKNKIKKKKPSSLKIYDVCCLSINPAEVI